MITDYDLTPFEFSDFWDDDVGNDDAPSSQSIEPITLSAISPEFLATAIIPVGGWHRISKCLTT